MSGALAVCQSKLKSGAKYFQAIRKINTLKPQTSRKLCFSASEMFSTM